MTKAVFHDYGHRCWFVRAMLSGAVEEFYVWADEATISESGDLFFWCTHRLEPHRHLNLALNRADWHAVFIVDDVGGETLAMVPAPEKEDEIPFEVAPAPAEPRVQQADDVATTPRPPVEVLRDPYVNRAMHRFIEKFSMTCAYCLRPGTATRGPDGAGWTRDHMKPQDHGGDHSVDNLVLCCRSCNSTKGTHSVDWMLARIEAKNEVSTRDPQTD